MIKVKRALISVYDKTGILDFARGLLALGVEIISTGQTARTLKDSGIPVQEVSQYTGFPEILNGRVKTLHPKIHGALLALRDKPEHEEQMKRHGILPLDMAVVNLYPFERVIQKKNISLDEVIENIDIGGPAILRSGAKNYKSVAVVCHPDRYQEILKELDMNSGILSDTVLLNLAIEVFQCIAHYDKVIYDYFSHRRRSPDFSGLPDELTLHLKKFQDLRYGENPQQLAAFYEDDQPGGLKKMKQRSGKELSLNNLLDLNTALTLIKDFTEPAAVIVKHQNPTGIAADKTLKAAYQQSLSGDPVSAFGGIIGLNKKVDGATAQVIAKGGFMECIIAPGYEKKAFLILSKRKSMRIVEINFGDIQPSAYDIKTITGGVLIQEQDEKKEDLSQWKVVTQRKPTAGQMASAIFGWKVIKYIKSNAVIIVKGTRTVGIGCGQTSRIDSAVNAIKKAGTKARQAILVSEAFLPKIDTVQAAAKAGIQVIIQSGGSIADNDVIKAADRAKIAMIMTGTRHFKH